MNKCSGAGLSSLTTAAACCHPLEYPARIWVAYPVRILHRVGPLFSSLNPNCRGRARPAPLGFSAQHASPSPPFGNAAPTTTLISLATQTNLWQSINHGKQRQRQARSKETKENHTKTTTGAPRRESDSDPRHQKSRRIKLIGLSFIAELAKAIGICSLILGSKTQTAQGCAFTFQVFPSVIEPDFISLQEPVECITSLESEDLPQLRLRQVPGLVLSQCKCFQGTAREFLTSSCFDFRLLCFPSISSATILGLPSCPGGPR